MTSAALSEPSGSISKDKRCTAMAAVSLALVLFAWHPSASDLLAAWQSDEYSHGMVIPFVAMLIGWHRLAEKQPKVQPSWLGLILLVMGGCLMLVGALATFGTAAHYGLILSLTGLALAFFGTQATRTIAPALVYLFFAVPLPHLAYVSLSEDLQLLSSTIGVMLLDLLNIPVFQEGNVIDLGQYKLQVAEACSGLRYLFPLLSFGYLIAYLLEDRWWKRVTVFLSAIPITILMNSLRIAFIGITVNIWGKEMAEGFIHAFEGWVVFLLCILLMMGEVWLLVRIPPSGRFRFNTFGAAHGPLFSGSLQPATPAFAALTLSALLAVIFGSGIINNRDEIIPPHPPFATFPTTLGKWHGQPHAIEPDILNNLKLSDYWLADYSTAEDHTPINFYIAYYASQRVGATTHSPSNCIPGGGWKIASSSEKTIRLDNGQSVTLSHLVIQKDGVSQLVYFWFDERGRDITQTDYAKWYLLLDSIRMHRTDGALIRLVTPVNSGESEAAAEKRLNHFLNLSYPAIQTFIPGRAP